MRVGFTLVELAVVLAVAGILAAVSLPAISRFRDGMGVRAATAESYALFGSARHLAILHARPATLEVDTLRRRLIVRSGVDTIRVRPLGAVHGVRLSASRLTTTYGPNGVAQGVSNLTLVIRRGSSADTLTVSRLGRVRR